MLPMLCARHMEARLNQVIQDTPVVLLQGPRQCGKTTLVQMFGQKFGYEYASFDDLATYKNAQKDPQAFINSLTRPTIIDEVQRVAEVLLPIKAAVDRQRRPGWFLLTGSVNVFQLPQVVDSLAGRIETLHLHPLSQAEIQQSPCAPILDALFQAPFQHLSLSDENIGPRIASGGYPAALQRDGLRRTHWYTHYVDTLLRHDSLDWAELRHSNILPELMSAACGQTAQLFNANNLAKKFKVSRVTVQNYLAVLEKLFLVHELPAWHSHKKSVKAAKLHVSDTGLTSALFNLNATNIKQNSSLYGHLLESFVLQELMRQASGLSERHQFFHYRENDRFEVDVVISRGYQQVVGVEVKASSHIDTHDLRGLKRLQQLAGKAFVAGYLLYQGNKQLCLGDNFFALPIQSLWQHKITPRTVK